MMKIKMVNLKSWTITEIDVPGKYLLDSTLVVLLVYVRGHLHSVLYTQI